MRRSRAASSFSTCVSNNLKSDSLINRSGSGSASSAAPLLPRLLAFGLLLSLHLSLHLLLLLLLAGRLRDRLWQERGQVGVLARALPSAAARVRDLDAAALAVERVSRGGIHALPF